MLAWMIILTVISVVIVIAYYYTIKELQKYRNKTDKLLDFDFCSRERNSYLVRPVHKVDTYDSTPVFVEGILDMRERLKYLEQRPSRYSQYHRDTGIDERSFELLEERVDNIADTAGAFEDRIKDVENDISSLRERVYGEEAANNATE